MVGPTPADVRSDEGILDATEEKHSVAASDSSRFHPYGVTGGGRARIGSLHNVAPAATIAATTAAGSHALSSSPSPTTAVPIPPQGPQFGGLVSASQRPSLQVKSEPADIGADTPMDAAACSEAMLASLEAVQRI